MSQAPPSSLTPEEKADLMELAEFCIPNSDRQLLELLAELAAEGCQAKDVRDYLRCLVANRSTAGRPGSTSAAVRPGSAQIPAVTAPSGARN